MKRYVLIILLGLAPVFLRSQDKSASDIIAAIAESGASMDSLECDFVQIRHSAMLSGDLRSEGRMSYRKPDMLLWEYTSPVRYSFVMDGAKISMKDAEGAEMSNSGSRKAFREIARLMTGNLTGRMLSDDRSFAVEAAETDGEWVVTLTPRRSDLQQMMSGMTMHYDVRLRSVVKVEMREPGGDGTVIEFKNIRYGAAR